MVLSLLFPSLTLELFEEAQVVLEHQADVVDAVLKHGDTLDTNTESKAGVYLRVNAAVFQHAAVHNASPQNFDPAAVLAQGAALAVAFKATYVNLHTGLSEREIGRAQAGFDLRAKQSLHKAVQHALQVAQGNALIHNQTFHLVEHRGVGCVRVRAEYAAGHQNLDGGLFLIHHTDLAAAGLGAQNNVIRHIESILHIAGRVVFGV